MTDRNIYLAELRKFCFLEATLGRLLPIFSERLRGGLSLSLSLSRSWSEVKVATSQQSNDYAVRNFHRKVFIESLQDRSVHRCMYQPLRNQENARVCLLKRSAAWLEFAFWPGALLLKR